MRSVTTAAIPSVDTIVQTAHARRSARLIGLAIASLVPAVFWSVVIEMVTHWIGAPLSPVAVATVGTTIALFLFVVCAPLVLRKADPEHPRLANPACTGLDD